MTVSRPLDLRVGDEIQLGDAQHTVVHVSGASVQLTDVTGAVFTIERAELFTDPGFRMVSTAPAPLPPQGVLDGLPAEAVARARWWEHHIVEVLAGVPPQAGPNVLARPEYGTVRTLRQREIAKVAELAALGRSVPLRTFQRMRRRYETGGLLSLIDGRITRQRSSKVDERVVDAVRQAVGQETDRVGPENSCLVRRPGSIR